MESYWSQGFTIQCETDMKEVLGMCREHTEQGYWSLLGDLGTLQGGRLLGFSGALAVCQVKEKVGGREEGIATQ